MPWSKRKPYYNLKQSMREFFSASVRYLKDSASKESFMEKPYKQLDRGAMHQAWPKYVFPPRAKYPNLPWWQPWKAPILGAVGRPRMMFPALKWPGIDPTNPTAVRLEPQKYVPGTRPRELSTSPSSPSDNQGGLWVQPSCSVDGDLNCLDIGESAIITAATNSGDAATWGVEISDPEALSAVIIWDTKLSFSKNGVPTYGEKQGTYIPRPKDTVVIELTALKEQSGQSVSVTIWATWVFRGKSYINRCGWFNISIPCDCDGNETPVAWDYAGSGTTVARNGSATIAVTGGKSPYKWEVSGTGFTLDSAETVGRSNTLNADGTACGTAVITITDICGSVATGYVRCTTGQWQATAIVTCIIPGDGTSSGGYWHIYKDQYYMKVKTVRLESCFQSCASGGGNCGAMCAGDVDCSSRCLSCSSAEPCRECVTNILPTWDYRVFPCFLDSSCGGGNYESQNCWCNEEIIVQEWVC